ncbi:hypothetical protein QR680_017895 [Steinernema hermaphroditum]|uniref:Uncharacterized protein n=1 Tax=Steinernema hermaphroditum TaxID=289476 RepID=A0AA39HG77_9BILA|nr:hypothetical protein QR680_017895 [Steinernema hermaphroditum]
MDPRLSIDSARAQRNVSQPFLHGFPLAATRKDVTSEHRGPQDATSRTTISPIICEFVRILSVRMTLHQELIHFLSSARSDPEMWKYVCADVGEGKIKQFLLQEYPEANPNGDMDDLLREIETDHLRRGIVEGEETITGIDFYIMTLLMIIIFACSTSFRRFPEIFK